MIEEKRELKNKQKDKKSDWEKFGEEMNNVLE